MTQSERQRRGEDNLYSLLFVKQHETGLNVKVEPKKNRVRHKRSTI